MEKSGIRIIRDFIPVSKYTRTGGKMKQVKAVIIHWVGNPGTSALNNHNYMKNIPSINEREGKQTYASWHYTVGLNGEIYNSIPEDEMAFHAGGLHYTDTGMRYFFDPDKKTVYPHDKCIGIEVCHPDSEGKFTDAAFLSAAALAADIVIRNNLTKNDILRHYDVTGKECPKYYVRNPGEWDRFLKKAEEIIRSGNSKIIR